jgi:hypothetical protein
MSEPFPFLPETSVALPNAPAEGDRFRVVATRRRPSIDETFEAFAFVAHDVFGSVVTLSPNKVDDKPETFRDLYRQWTEALGRAEVPRSILGETLVFRAHVAGGFDPEEPTVVFESAREALRCADLEIWDVGYVTTSGFVLWEGPVSKGRRVVLVVADAGDAPERELDRWLWWRDDGGFIPFGRYLASASKLYFETAEFYDFRHNHEAARRALECEVTSVFRAHSDLEINDTAGIDELLEAQRKVLNLQGGESGFVDSAARLRELRNTVRVAAYNMKTNVPTPRQESIETDESLFGRDRQRARWLEEQIETDLEYAQAALERANGAQALTALHLEQATEQHHRFQERISQVQAITAGVLLGAITVVQWGPQRRDLAVPLALTYGAFILAFPLTVAHWSRHFSMLDRIAVVVFTGFASWLVVAAVWEGAGWWAAFAMLVGAPLGWWLTDRHAPRRSSKEKKAST